MKREQYCFAIGYNGGDAIVDKRAMSRYGKKSPRELADLGLYKSALSAALFDDDREGQQYVLEKFNEKSGAALADTDNLVKVLGIIPSWKEISTVRYV
ncbi:MAG: hypothetical protein PQJ59_18395 [Spirochaetales bacterium]|nr:hypothetical protein [Spirochaetales bacterium]